MLSAILMALVFGYVAWLMTSSENQIAVPSRGAYDNILSTVRVRFERGDLEADEYERILRVLQESAA